MTKLLFLVIFVYMSTLLSWWQNLPSAVNPVIFEIGSFPIQWYGLMYVIAVMIFIWMGGRRLRKPSFQNPSENFHKNLVTPAFLGVFLGGRLGYVLFYNFSYYFSHPLEILLPFNAQGQLTGISGMSFHGGVIGSVIAFIIYCRIHKTSFISIADFYMPGFPLGYMFGRIGNFMNGELYGRVTEYPIGMYFSKTDSSGLLRHPSQLYEAFSEGLLCFIFLWWVKDRVKNRGSVFALYLISYGIVRFIIEFLRQPDSQFKDANDSVGFVFSSFSMGQVLCFFMIVFGLGIFYYFRDTPLQKNPSNSTIS